MEADVVWRDFRRV